MKKLFAVGMVLGIASTVLAAPYAGGWTQQWNFDDGAQGWTLGGAAFWNNAGGTDGSGAISTPDSSWATLGGFNLNGNPGTAPFVFQADIWVSNAGNFIQDQGINVYRTGDGKGPQVAGSNAANKGVAANDKSWLNSTKRSSWVFEDATAQNLWHTLQIDYGVTTPGKFTGWVKLNGSGWWGTGPVWKPITSADTYDVSPDLPPSKFEVLRIGAVNTPLYGGGWGQARMDNVKLYVVPEPASLALLALGFVGLIRRR